MGHKSKNKEGPKSYHVRSGDEVRVISGSFKNSQGKVLRMITGTHRVELEIPDLADDRKIKKHVKRSQQFPQGTIMKMNPTIHVSNVMKMDEFNRRKAKRPEAAKTKKS